MQRLWKAKDAPAFYLIDDEAPLAAGDLVLVDLRKQEQAVDPAAAQPFRVPEGQARELAIAEMARFRDAARRGVRELADVAKQIRRKTWEAEDTTAPAVLAARHRAERPDAAALMESLRPQLEALSQRITALMTEDGDTAEGRARLRRIAETVRDGGGPDWTGDPASIPERLRGALDDPALAGRLGNLLDDLRRRIPDGVDPDGKGGQNPGTGGA